MNVRHPVHRTGVGLLHALRVYAWLVEQREPVTAPHTAATLDIDPRQARRTLARLESVGAACRSDGRWVALDVVPT